jgi:hypothetical protein
MQGVVTASPGLSFSVVHVSLHLLRQFLLIFGSRAGTYGVRHRTPLWKSMTAQVKAATDPGGEAYKR